MKTCSDCALWVPAHSDGWCHCYPEKLKTGATDWCGQHRGKAGRPAKSAKPLEKKA